MSSVSVNKKYDFTGKVALVTGSSSGIGAAIATQLAQYGARVCITGQVAANLEKVAAKIMEVSGVKPLQVVGNLAEESFSSKLVQKTVDHFGRLDILVNNAGCLHPNMMFGSENMMEGFDKVMRVNLRTAVQLIYMAVPHLEKTKGNVINISSICALRPHSVVYSTSKAALDMVTKSGAMELGPRGIRVNSINPGPVWTAIGRTVDNERLFHDLEAGIKERYPLARVADPDEIANLASFIASDDAKNITGAIILSDGGMNVEKILQL